MAIDLLNPSTQSYVRSALEEIIDYDDVEEAQNLLKLLRDNLPDQQAQVSGSPELYEQYRNAWITCQFIRLYAIPDEDFFDLIKEHLVEGLKLNEYNIIEKIGRRLQFMDLQSEQVNLIQQVLDILKKNTQLLGDKNLTQNGRVILPTIQNWLEDYDSFPTKNAGRSDLDEVNYINKGTNPSILSADDKNVLLEIIKLYDSLRNRLSAYNVLPEAKEDTFTGDKYALLFPGAVVIKDGVEPSSSLLTKVKPPVISKSETNSTLTNTPAPIPPTSLDTEVMKQAVDIISTPSSVKAPPVPAIETAKTASHSEVMDQIKKNLEAKKFNAPPRPLNVQDMLNERDTEKHRGGIVFDTPSSEVPPVPPVAPKKAVVPTQTEVPPNLPIGNMEKNTNDTAQEDIDQKLAELRTRAKNLQS